MADTMTKKEMTDLLDEVGEKVSEMLDPVLTREELVAKVQELDALVNDDEQQTEADEEGGDEEPE